MASKHRAEQWAEPVDLLERARIAASENPWHDVPIAADIWAELMRRRRKDGRFLYPTRLDIGDTAEQRQKLTIELLFSMALVSAENPRPIVLRREFEALRTDLQTMAEASRSIVARMQQLRLCKPHHINPLITAAEEAHDLAARLGDRAIVVKRGRGRSLEQAVAVGIADACRWLFGSTLPRVVVVGLVKILLDRDIQAFEVQNWCKANCRARSRALTRKNNKKPISRSYY
jgi:hypothetical protein